MIFLLPIGSDDRGALGLEVFLLQYSPLILYAK